jgi:hypothetical protein
MHGETVKFISGYSFSLCVKQAIAYIKKRQLTYV